ncbi:MAG: hypothetical protein KBB70_01895 [Candidatus Pacebacteria bacterium]|jgi:hypothetical protein|nr:hypothetical protein [Candidatus Paceibacterota bacterium]
MTPPTGLTFVIHAVIVIVRKTLALLGFDRPIPIEHSTGDPLVPSEPAKRHLQALYSVVVILLVSVYMFWIVIMFIGKAVEDKHANWKVAGNTVASVKEVILSIDIPTPPALTNDSVRLSGNASRELYIPYRFFSDKASPYISLYTQTIHIINAKQ